MPSSLHGVFSFVLYLQFEVAVPTGKGGRGRITCSSNAGAFNDGRAIYRRNVDTRGPRKMDEAFRAASEGVSLILFQKGHPSASRYGFLRDLESSEPFLICSHFL
jgi:hypothetical protein